MKPAPFDLGKLVAARTVLEKVNSDQIGYMLSRHLACDSDCCPEDHQLNVKATHNDDRVFSVYKMSEIGETIYIITEWDRSYTTVMLAEDY